MEPKKTSNSTEFTQDSSFENWYTYLRQEEHLEPEEAERQAYLNHRAGYLIPKVTKNTTPFFENDYLFTDDFF